MSELSLRNTSAAWGGVSIALHWLMAVLIIGQFILGVVAEGMAVSPAKFDLFVWHKSLGATVLLLLALRLSWRVSNPTPVLPAELSRPERQAARWGHVLLYLLMLAVPLSGWVISDSSRIPFRIFWSVPTPDLLEANRQLSETAADAHYVLVLALAVVVAGHIAAALHHHLVKQNQVLRRMLPWGGS